MTAPPARARGLPSAPDGGPAAALATHRADPGGVDGLALEVGPGRLGGLDPERLAAEHGTPFFVYDLDVVGRRVAALRQALPPVVDLAYALKANPALGVVAHVAGLGLGADVASGGELALAERAGMAPERIVFTGPGKTDEELAAAVTAGLRAVTVESVGELERLDRIAAGAERRVPVLVRAATLGGEPVERHRLVGDAGSAKFGMDAADLRLAARLAKGSGHLDLLGLHAFGASNVLDAGALADHVIATVERARAIAADLGLRLRLVDAGGGLGIPYAAGERPLDLDALGVRLAAATDDWARDPATAAMRVLLEPGRFLVGPIGAYVARVVDRKVVAGRQVAILDGGIHHLVRPALTRQAHRVVLLIPDATRRQLRSLTLAGPLCSGLDVLATGLAMPEPRVGDLVAVLDAGAYGYSESMPFFLSHAIPAEVAIVAGMARRIRPRIEPGTWLALQSTFEAAAGA